MAQYKSTISSDSTAGESRGSYFIIGRVKSVVLGKEKYDGEPDPNYTGPKDLGKITYEILYTNLNQSRIANISIPAYPIFSFIKLYPLISEIVLIVPGPSSEMNDGVGKQDYYYFPPYSTWNSLNHNAFPNMQEYAEYLKDFYNNQDYNNNLRQETEFPTLPLGVTFSEAKDVRALRPFEGDTILESRFGQSIRFSSTVLASRNLNTWSNSGELGKPITIIRNGQGKQNTNDYFENTVENVNVDDLLLKYTKSNLAKTQSVLTNQIEQQFKNVRT